MMFMKILFFIRHYFDTWGGIEEHVYNISSIFQENNQVTITAPTSDKQHIKYSPGISYVDHRNVRISDFDVIFIENFEIFPHIVLCFKVILDRIINQKHCKIILVPHGGFTLKWDLFGWKQRIVKFLYNKTFGLFFINRFCDLVVAVSDWEKKALIQEGVTKEIVVIRNGFDIQDAEAYKENLKENYFIFVGRIVSIKNLEEVILCYKSIVQDKFFQDYKMLIVGSYEIDSDYFLKIKKIVQDNDLVDGVVFLGAKYGKEKYELISRAACLFCLSHVEHDPVVLKESFSVKTKVMINSNFGLEDYRGEKNIFLKNENAVNLSRFYEFLKKDFMENLNIPLLSWADVTAKYEKLF